MKTKDFSMLLEKVSTDSSKKDIGYVDDQNSFVAQIENLFKTKKGENISDIYFGSDISSYVEYPSTNSRAVVSTLSSAIKYGIKNIFNPRVSILSSTQSSILFQIEFSYPLGPNTSTKTSCTIEIPVS